MAPGRGATLFVSIPGSDGTVLVLLDRDGSPLRGWPIGLPASSYCRLLLPVDDGSVRVVCYIGDPNADGAMPVWAFAFDAGGRPLAGWPVDLTCCSDGLVIGRVIGDTLTVHERQYRGDSVDGWIVSVAADGTVRNGERVTYSNCCSDIWAVGPGGVAYRIVLHFDDTGAATTSELVAVGPTGLFAGFPVVIRGIASKPAFDAAGRIHVTVATVTVATPFDGPARTLVLGADGQAVVGGSGELGMVATCEGVGIEGTCVNPAPPLVGPDGTTFVVGAYFNSTTVVRVDPSGQVMAGWPYRSDAGHQSKGICPTGAACEGYSLAAPAIGPDNVLYLLHAARGTSVGGSIVAVGPDGRVVAGWPVELRRPGAEFWSVATGPTANAYALAIEPETGGTSSATVLAIAPDSTVLYRTTIIDP